MSVKIETGLNPAVECILFLERTFAQTDEHPNPMAATCQRLAEKHGIPIDLVEEKAAPLRELDAELMTTLEGREDLWGEMFYTGSSQENLLAWGFFYLDQQGTFPPVDIHLRRRLICLMLNCMPDQLVEVRDIGDLFRVVDRFSCSNQTKWVCARVWQHPEEYYRRYRKLVDLSAPVILRHSQNIQDLCEAATSHVVRSLEQDPELFWKTMGLPMTPLESLQVFPMAINFNGRGVIWDQTIGCDTAYLLIGILREPLQELIALYCDNSPYLADRLKSIADLRRVEILKLLKNAPMYGQELADVLKLSPATISHHMSFLVSCGFVSVTRKGAKTSYSLHRQNLDSFLQNLRISLL